MAESVSSAVKAVIDKHPGWTQLEVFNSLKGKYGAQELSQAISTEYTKAQAAAKAKAEASVSAGNAAVNKQLTPEQLIAQIVRVANSTDPTATGTVTSPTISPLTNTPVNIKTGIQYSSVDWQQDFIGVNGQPARLQYLLDPVTKQAYVGFGPTKSKVAVIGDPKNPGNYAVVDFTTATTDILKNALAKKGGLLALKQKLVGLNYLTGTASKQSLAAGDKVDDNLAKALVRYLESLTATNVIQGAANPLNIQSFNTSIAGAPVTSLAGTKTSIFTELTRKEAAASELSAFMQSYLGEGPSSKEIDDYVKALNTAEKAAPRKSTVTTDASGAVRSSTTIGGGLTAEEKQGLMVGVVLNRLKAANVDPAAISKSGGIVARYMDTLRETAGMYGVRIDDSMALQKAASAIKVGGDIKAQQEIIKQTAKVQYKSLASAIDQGVTVRDIADQFNQYKNRVLELANPTDVFDPDMQAALQGDGNKVMGINDFIIKMRNKPEWAKTQNAREEASNYAISILQSFGLMG